MRHKKIRFVYMILAGIIITFLLDLTVKGAVEEHNRFFDFFTSITITILVWEGNLRLDTGLNNRFPWEQSSARRILLQLPLSLIYSSAMIFLSMWAFNKYVCALPDASKERFMITAVIIGTLVSIIILSVELCAQFFVKWKKSLVEVEKYKSESLSARLQNLKDQINPHFMFNNLSVLSSLVYKDQDKAVDFINQLSKVYRYVLDSRNIELVSLKEELTFLKSYTYLLQIRFDSSLKFVFAIPEQDENFLLPPMALQMLIENAIKHNEVSSAAPLTIEIQVQYGKINVSNNLQLRSLTEPSCKTGLKNIVERYKFFTEETVDIASLENFFLVKIPLLKTK